MKKKSLFIVFLLGISILVFSCGTFESFLEEDFNTSATANTNGRDDPDAVNWDISSLDTAAKADYLSAMEKDVILEMNKARNNPKKYAELYIKPMLQYNWGGPFGANSYLAPGETDYKTTQEGRNGIQSCVDDLSGRQSMPPLIPAKGLFLSARDHATDIGKKDMTGHTGSDGSTMGQRISRHGEWDISIGENISYKTTDGRSTVVRMLIDDGTPSRGHRENVLNKKFKYAGAAFADHLSWTNSCVIDYASEFTEK